MLAFLAIMAFLGAACGASEPAPPESPELYVLSNSSPHVSVIDTDTNRVVRHADIPGLTLWSWNDDNNYYDGQNMWLGMRDPDSDEAEVVPLDLDSLTVASRLAIGKGKETIYIGKVAPERCAAREHAGIGPGGDHRFSGAPGVRHLG